MNNANLTHPHDICTDTNGRCKGGEHMIRHNAIFSAVAHEHCRMPNTAITMGINGSTNCVYNIQIHDYIMLLLGNNANFAQLCHQSSCDFKLIMAIQTGISIRTRFYGVWLHRACMITIKTISHLLQYLEQVLTREEMKSTAGGTIGKNVEENDVKFARV